MPAKKKSTTPYAIVHHFPGGTKAQYQASLKAVHPGKNSLPAGQIFHSAGPSESGWTVVAIHESKKSWEQFLNTVLMPKFKKGIKGGFKTPPQESTFKVSFLLA